MQKNTHKHVTLFSIHTCSDSGEEIDGKGIELHTNNFVAESQQQLHFNSE